MTDLKQATLKLPFSGREYVIYGGAQDESIMRMLVDGGGRYELDTMQLIAKLVKRDSVCIDIGANLGVMSLAMSSLVPLGHVFAFEALPQIYAYLQRNLSANGVSNVTPLNLAVYDKNGSLTMDYVAEFAGGSYASETGVHDHRSHQTEVSCVTLDDWVDQQRLSRLDFVKIDIEGSEVRALAGATRVLRQYKPNLVIECNSHTLKLFQGTDPSHLWDSLTEIYPHIHLLLGNNRIMRLKSRKNFDEQLPWQNQTVMHNLLCSFKKW